MILLPPSSSSSSSTSLLLPTPPLPPCSLLPPPLPHFSSLLLLPLLLLLLCLFLLPPLLLVVSPQVEGEKAELVERCREAESEWAASLERLQQQLYDGKRSLAVSECLLKETVSCLEEELGQLQTENGRLLEQYTQVKGEATHNTLHTLLSRAVRYDDIYRVTI